MGGHGGGGRSSSVAVGIEHGTFVAADSDPYGYVSEADLMTHGALRVDQSFARGMPWPFPEWSFSPPAYRPVAGGFIVPTYPPGLPLVMAAFQRARGRGAVFYVVPLLGALAVLMTAALGARLHSPLAGALAAVLLVSSPSVLYQVTAAGQRRTGDGVVDGEPGDGAAGRREPRIRCRAARGSRRVDGDPDAAEPGSPGRRHRALSPLEGRARVPWTTAGPRLGAWHSSPWVLCPGVSPSPSSIATSTGRALQSGYGDLGPLYSLANFARESGSVSPMARRDPVAVRCLAVFAPWAVGRNAERASDRHLRASRIWLALAFVAAVFLSYLFYVPWDRDNWGYVRFLLPAYPPLLVLSVAVALEGVDGMIRAPAGRRFAATLAACAALVTWQTRTAIDRGVFAVGLVEQRYADVGQFVASVMPPEAVFISGAEAGSVRYYSNRLTMRFDLLSPRWLDIAVRTLRDKGYRPYILLEESEEQPFRERFEGAEQPGRARLAADGARYDPIRVRIYDPDDRPRFLAGEGIAHGRHETGEAAGPSP